MKTSLIKYLVTGQKDKSLNTDYFILRSIIIFPGHTRNKHISSLFLFRNRTYLKNKIYD